MVGAFVPRRRGGLSYPSELLLLFELPLLGKLDNYSREKDYIFYDV